MRKSILMMLLAIVSNSAAAEWVVAGENDTSVVYIDRATIREAGDIVKMMALFNLKKPRMVDVLPYMSSKVQYEYDCKKGWVRMLDSNLYSGKMGDGAVVYSVADSADWEMVVPDTVNEGLSKFACGKQ
jgi:hypothetical protein